MSHRRRSKMQSSILGAIAACMSVPMVSQSAIFTNEADWQTAAGSFALETFESQGVFGTEITTLPTLKINFATPNNIYDGRNGGPLFGTFSLINTFPFNTNLLDPFSITPIDGEVITSLGVWNASGDDNLLITFYDADDAVLELTTISRSNSQPLFGGIVNELGASRVEIGGTVVTNLWIAIDNLQVTTVPVPEPATLTVFAIGALMMLHHRRVA